MTNRIQVARVRCPNCRRRNAIKYRVRRVSVDKDELPQPHYRWELVEFCQLCEPERQEAQRQYEREDKGRW